MTNPTIDQTLARLNQGMKRLRVLCSIAIFAACAAFLIAGASLLPRSNVSLAESATVPQVRPLKEVSAHRFALVSAQGKVMATLGLLSDGDPELALMDQGGDKRATLFVNHAATVASHGRLELTDELGSKSLLDSGTWEIDDGRKTIRFWLKIGLFDSEMDLVAPEGIDAIDLNALHHTSGLFENGPSTAGISFFSKRDSASHAYISWQEGRGAGFELENNGRSWHLP